MRTSRISHETARVVSASASSTRRATRSSLSQFLHSNGSADLKSDDKQGDSPDIEDAIRPARKRKRSSVMVSARQENLGKNFRVEAEVEQSRPLKSFAVKSEPKDDYPRKSLRIKSEVEDSLSVSRSPSKTGSRVRKPARQVKNEDTGEVEIHPPNDWEEVYAVVKEMRKNGPAKAAAVDTMGCERLAEREASPRDQRFQTLIALMLSSQTKDTTNAVAMARLQKDLPPYKAGAPAGLNLDNILAVDPKLLNEFIWVVGFHNNKTKYIKAAAEILRDKWNGDIPDTAEGLMSLPGVGPKMAYLCLSVAWGRTEGIGVDVHVHRITNMWGWHKTKNPEETRMVLQAWLPKELWHEINWLLVGFGQTVCLPVGRKCGDCELGLRGLCKAAERAKVILGRKMREEAVKKDENGDAVKVETVKIEEVIDEGPLNAPSDEGVNVNGQGDGEKPTDEGLSKKDEAHNLDTVNVPGELEKKPTKRRRKL